VVKIGLKLPALMLPKISCPEKIGAMGELIWCGMQLRSMPAPAYRKKSGRKQPPLQTGADIDIGFFPLDAIDPGVLEQVLDTWPRLGFKTTIIEAFTDLALETW